LACTRPKQDMVTGQYSRDIGFTVIYVHLIGLKGPVFVFALMCVCVLHGLKLLCDTYIHITFS
jgi:hypothetical protein